MYKKITVSIWQNKNINTVAKRLKNWLCGWAFHILVMPSNSIIWFNRMSVLFGYIDDNGHPISCRFCHSDKLVITEKDYIEHIVCERQCNCSECGKQLGYWSYGNWEII